MEALLGQPEAAQSIDWRNSDNGNSTALIQASFAGKASCVAALLRAGADVDAADEARLLPASVCAAPRRASPLSSAAPLLQRSGRAVEANNCADVGLKYRE